MRSTISGMIKMKKEERERERERKENLIRTHMIKRQNAIYLQGEQKFA